VGVVIAMVGWCGCDSVVFSGGWEWLLWWWLGVVFFGGLVVVDPMSASLQIGISHSRSSFFKFGFASF
jgi:hypothetical protein